MGGEPPPPVRGSGGATTSSASASAAPVVGQRGVKYGLQLPPSAAKRNAGSGVRRPQPQQLRPALQAFAQDDDDSDDDGDGNGGIGKQIASYQRHAHSAENNEQAYRQALREDPTVFEYDAVYDSLREGREAGKRKEKLERGSRYIADLKAKAVERQREQDAAFDRQKLREIHREDHLYGDKEKFVTGAYRKKLEEERKWIESEQRKEEEERKNDVKKRGNLNAFYANLLTNNVAFGAETKGAAGEGKPNAGDDRDAEQSGPGVSAPRGQPPMPARAAPAEPPRASWQDASSGRALAGPPFIESRAFAGERDGYVFKSDVLGLGYYADGPLASAELQILMARAAATASAKGAGKGPAEAEPPKAKGGKGVTHARRNTEETIEAARQRYFERKRRKTHAVAV